VSAVVIGIVTIRICFGDSEPSYDGKSLSDWVVAMRDGPERDKARGVVHQMGTNYLPVLVEWLQREDHPTMQGRFHSFEEGTQEWMIRRGWTKPHSMTSYLDAKESYHALGLLALEELGPDGKAAIPTLINLLGETNAKQDDVSMAAGAAFLILPKMSPNSIGPLIQALSSSNMLVRALASGALANIGTNANAAIPILETWLRDRPIYLIAAVNALDNIGGDPKVFVPAVIASLDERYVETLAHTKYDSLSEKVYFLIKYKSEAKPAVPKLVAIYKNTPDDQNTTNISTRQEVVAALREIDPATAASISQK